jgi:16S rRNA (cytosine967-C5)-methyltransferase
MAHLHKNLVKTTAAGLKRVFNDQQHAEMVLEKLLASDKRLGARDRRFIAETFYDLVRYRRHIEILGDRLGTNLFADPFLLVSAWLVHKGNDLSAWPECEMLKPDLLLPAIEGMGPREISVPDWLWETGMTELGERWPAEIQALNESAPIYLRVNGLKTDVAEVLQVLETEGVEASEVPGHPWAIRLSGRTNVIRLGSFRKGLYEVQDAASQRISPFLEVEPGQVVIDACAGAGGKSLHLAALMEDTGRIVSMDVEAWKLNEVKKRASRAGIKSIGTELINGQKTLKYWREKADRLLLDAPCSGLGVLRRHPDTKWKLSPEALEEVKEVQADILDRYCDMVKPGGKMVYATCSLMPGENEQQVERFLEEHPEFVLEEQVRTWPSEGWDGFFMARMAREV